VTLAGASDPEAPPRRTNSGAAATDPVVAVARAFERDLYTSALLAPRSARRDLMTIAAFVGEIGRIPPFVSEPMMGEIRFQWWRDSLEAGHATGALSGHPVADALADLMRRHAIAPARAIGIIDAHGLRLDSEPPEDLYALKVHLAKIYGAAFELAAKVMSATEAADGPSPALVQQAGVAYGLARVAFEFAPLRSHDVVLMPADWLRDAGLTPTAVRSGEAPETIVAVNQRLFGEAAALRAKVTGADLTRSGRLACLPLAMVRTYARAAERRGRDHLVRGDDVVPLARMWAIWRAWVASL